MHTSSTYKMLSLLYLLASKECTKKDIIEKLSESNISITSSLITRYVDKFIKNGIDIKSKINDKRENVYCLNKNNLTLNFSDSEMSVISDVKKLLMTQKNYDRIRKTMRLFYKLANYIQDEDRKLSFIDFGYFSTINWHLVRQLEEHCREKNVITLDYILPQKGNKILTIHADSIKMNDWSDRLYLNGVLEGSNRFSILPIDRIYMIKKIEKRNAEFKLDLKTITYVVDKNIYEKLPIDKEEKVVEINGNKVKLQRCLDDEFRILQRFFSYAPEISNISDERIKNLFKEKLQMLKAIYES